MKNEKKKIGIAAGGTGGHLIPAEVISLELEEYEIFLLGHKVEKSPYLNDPKIQKIDIPAAAPRKTVKEMLIFFQRTIFGFFTARKVLKKQKPDLVLCFGSFYTFPALLAAVSMRIPLVFFEANRVPGRIVSIFSRFALWVAIPYKDVLKKINTVQEEIKFPLRSEFVCKKSQEKQNDKLTIIVMGGSQGASFLNDRTPFLLAPYKEEIKEVIHLCGKHGDPDVISEVYESLGVNANVKSYCNNIAELMQSADLAICRCGASTIAELEATFLPALLIPFPFAMDGHQAENAKYYCETKKGGWWILQKDATLEKLKEIMEKIIKDRSLLEEARKSLEESKDHIPTLASLIHTTLKKHPKQQKGKYVHL